MSVVDSQPAVLPNPGPAEADRIDVDAIRRVVDRVLPAQGSRPASADAEELEGLLRGHLQLLLSAVRTASRDRAATAAEQLLDCELDGSPDDRVRLLALDCRWLLRYVDANGRPYTRRGQEPARPTGPQVVDWLALDAAVKAARALYRSTYQRHPVRQVIGDLTGHLRTLLPVCECTARTVRDEREHERLAASLRHGRQLLAETPVGSGLAELTYMMMLADCAEVLHQYAARALPVDPLPVLRAAAELPARNPRDPGDQPSEDRLAELKGVFCTALQQMIPVLQTRAWLLPADDTDRNLAQAALGYARSLLAYPSPVHLDRLEYVRSLASSSSSLLYHLQRVSYR